MTTKKQLLLIGGGHAHLSVLRALASRRFAAWQITLITPHPHQIYSGMLPGLIAGHYQLAQCRIDVHALAQTAGVEVIYAAVTQLDCHSQTVLLSDGRKLTYALLSLDIGSESRVSELQALDTSLTSIRPIERFLGVWQDLRQRYEASPQPHSLAVVGGGAAGVEMAFALQYALQKISPQSRVSLFTNPSGLLPGHDDKVRTLVKATMQQRGITLHLQRVIASASGLISEDGQQHHFDHVLATTGAHAPACIHGSGLATDTQGFVAVNSRHQSLSHPNVFAAGDVCSRATPGFSRSGVHAVKAGPVLANNLLSILAEMPPQAEYAPRPASLYLLATGPQHAIGSWGRFCFQGAWVWRWKDWIDRGFIRRYS